MTKIAFVLRIALVTLALVVVFVILGFPAYSIFLFAKWLIGLVSAHRQERYAAVD
jgi:hypothetical protein